MLNDRADFGSVCAAGTLDTVQASLKSLSPNSLWSRLARVLAEAPRESARLLHGRGGTVPELGWVTADWFEPVVLVVVYDPQTPAWWDDARANAAALVALPRVDTVVVQRRDQRDAPLVVLAGTLPDEVRAVRAGLSYELAIGAGRNVGFFLDMAPGHAWVRAHAEQSSVLNLFAYTCAFSVSAIAGGASRVVNLDMSRRALSIGERNQHHNGQRGADVRYLSHDVFKSWGKLRRLGPFGLIIVDPPTYQFRSFVTDRDYPRVLRRLDSLAAPDARVLLCLNNTAKTPRDLIEAVAEHAPQLEFVERLPIASDHPEARPEDGLKLLVFSRR